MGWEMTTDVKDRELFFTTKFIGEGTGLAPNGPPNCEKHKVKYVFSEVSRSRVPGLKFQSDPTKVHSTLANQSIIKPEPIPATGLAL